MMGPSSSHTAGAARIGYMARLLVGSQPDEITLCFHPVLMQTYAGHRTHAALVAGLLGYREDDPRGVNALDQAKAEGIRLNIEQVDEWQSCHQNTMRIKARNSGLETIINGVSVGGGCIQINAVDGVKVDFDGNNEILVINSDGTVDDVIKNMLPSIGAIFSGSIDGKTVSYFCFSGRISEQCVHEISLLPHVSAVRVIPPLTQFSEVGVTRPLFANFAELAELADLGRKLPELALDYECKRSNQERSAVMENFAQILAVMREGVEAGLAGQQLLGGFCAGNDGLKMMEYYRSGRSITGGIFPLALARSLAVMEVNGAMGRVVASPTAGSAGVIPGVIMSTAELLELDDAAMIDALLVGAAVGICIANKASLSGAVGGCQGEIGVASAMAAAAVAHLGGGSPEDCIHAASLTIKNILGLICDPPAGPVEVPCIKRNAIGVAAAFAGATMALAGIRSFIPPDEVVDALVDTQQRLPQELKGSTIGGLACTKTGARMRQQWTEKLRKM